VSHGNAFFFSETGKLKLLKISKKYVTNLTDQIEDYELPSGNQTHQLEIPKLIQWFSHKSLIGKRQSLTNGIAFSLNGYETQVGLFRKPTSEQSLSWNVICIWSFFLADRWTYDRWYIHYTLLCSVELSDQKPCGDDVESPLCFCGFIGGGHIVWSYSVL
jgi:hypothetical protein